MSGSIEKPFPKQVRSIVLLYYQTQKLVNYFSLRPEKLEKLGCAVRNLLMNQLVTTSLDACDCAN